MTTHSSRETYLHVVESTAKLITESGESSASTRAICAAAGIQPPALYRLFGDKQGLLDAVASHSFDVFMADHEALTTHDDPVEGLRASWDLHVNFGLTHPHMYWLTYGAPRQGPAALKALDLLNVQLQHIAQAGRLRVSQEQASDMTHATVNGTTLALLNQPPEERDLMRSNMAREAILSAITIVAAQTQAPSPHHAAITMKAWAPQLNALTLPERLLLQEWLDRVITTP